MSNLIEFPKQNQAEQETPSYAGHILMLDLSKARKFQCFNFWLGIRNRVSVVPEDAAMERIRQAVADGVLLDITEHPELFVPEKSIADVSETDTGKKIYSGTRKFFTDLGVGEPIGPGDFEDETVAYATDSRDEQSRIEEALRQAPVSAAEPVTAEQARQRASRPLLSLPPGMDEPDRYALPFPVGNL